MKIKFFTIVLVGLLLCNSMSSQGQKSNELIEKGLAYLASVQSTSKGMDEMSGTSIEPFLLPEEPKIAGHWQGDVGITALCLQAFVANGHGVNDALYGTVVTNAITYILGQQITSGYHAGAFNQTNYGYGSAMAIVGLQSAVNSAGLTDPLKTEVQNAIDLAVNYYTQDVNPGWSQVSWRYDRSYTSTLSGDMSVNQWVYLALNSTNYTDKDIWSKVYGYINSKKSSSGNYAWIGYQSSGNRPRGNTCAGIWGLILADQNNVTGAEALSQKMLNYLEQNSLSNLFPANANSALDSWVYSGGGYYYYIYELGKALALSNKSIFSGAEWKPFLFNTINNQKYTDANGNYYWNGWGGQGVPMETALALLSIQTETVPLGSKLNIALTDQDYLGDCTEFLITNEFGNEASVTPVSVENNIIQSQWIETNQDYMEWEIDLENAGNYNTLITNLCTETKLYELCYRVYIDGSLIDEECFNESKSFIEVPPLSSVSSTAFVNSIGGLNIIIVNPPTIIPLMQLSPDIIAYNPFEYNQTYNFTFDVTETGGESPLENVDLFASALTDEFGNVIPAGNISLTPSQIALVPAGSSVAVQGTLTTPASFTKEDIGLFQGVITAQTSQQAKSVKFEIGKPTMTLAPDVLNVGYSAGTTGFDINFTGFVGTDWTIEVDAPWLSVNMQEGTGNQAITVNYNQNTTPAERTALITVTAPDALNPELSVTVIQEMSPSQADQVIALETGWLGISSFIIPDDPNVASMFAEINTQVVILLRNGGIYWPQFNINTFGNWNVYEGYKIKMNSPALLEINGVPAQTTVSFPAGSHYLPVLSSEPVAVEDILDPLQDAILYVYNIQNGQIYWPGGNLITLQTLEPGVGYLMNLLQPATFDFAMKSTAIPQPVTPTENITPWKNVINTGNPHFISFDKNALSALEAGDVIGVFNADNTISGMATYLSDMDNMLLVVYGSDVTSKTKDGLDEGEEFVLKLYRPQTGEFANITATYDSDYNMGTFLSGDVSIIRELKATALSMNELETTRFAVYPNPSSGIINIVSPGQAHFSVLDTKGQIVNSGIVNGNSQLDLSALNRGVYFVKIGNNDDSHVFKIVLK
jgi:hypothetical protein